MTDLGAPGSTVRITARGGSRLGMGQTAMVQPSLRLRETATSLPALAFLLGRAFVRLQKSAACCMGFSEIGAVREISVCDLRHSEERSRPTVSGGALAAA